jgi:hypothetical protein
MFFFKAAVAVLPVILATAAPLKASLVTFCLTNESFMTP